MTSADRQWWRRYERYLTGQDWELTREACLRRDSYRCCRCGLAGSPSNPLHAAHLTYETYNRTGRTPPGDLRTLCRHCHEITTGQKFPDRAFSHWLWQWWWRLTSGKGRAGGGGLARPGPDPLCADAGWRAAARIHRDAGRWQHTDHPVAHSRPT